MEQVAADPCMLAGLTYPITAAYILACLKRRPEAGELTVVVLGAMALLEVRRNREGEEGCMSCVGVV